MKISKLFHWLYAFLCFLPLLVAPIFALAVRSDNNFQPISITVNESSFQPKFKTNEVNNYTDIVENNVYHYDNLNIDANDFTSSYFCSFYGLNFSGLLVNFDSFYVDEFTNDSYNSNVDNVIRIDINTDSSTSTIFYTNINVYCAVVYEDLVSISITDFDFYVDDVSGFLALAQDIGQLPTSSTFQSYEYVESTPIVYDDTDVGSQLLYTLYNTTEKYMNFDDVLNLKAINEWINLNVFNGNAPLIWTIIWHYLDYWLLLSIFWLCFDVLIYVPQLAHRWLDKASLE